MSRQSELGQTWGSVISLGPTLGPLPTRQPFTLGQKRKPKI